MFPKTRECPGQSDAWWWRKRPFRNCPNESLFN